VRQSILTVALVYSRVKTLADEPPPCCAQSNSMQAIMTTRVAHRSGVDSGSQQARAHAIEVVLWWAERWQTHGADAVGCANVNVVLFREWIAPSSIRMRLPAALPAVPPAPTHSRPIIMMNAIQTASEIKKAAQEGKQRGERGQAREPRGAQTGQASSSASVRTGQN